ncbi:MAG: hypothetical protein H7836_08045 [Magnetococcus sp. YQC-3]
MNQQHYIDQITELLNVYYNANVIVTYRDFKHCFKIEEMFGYIYKYSNNAIEDAAYHLFFKYKDINTIEAMTEEYLILKI